MHAKALPRAAPIPKISKYTDEITFNHLGLPSSLTDEDFLVDLYAIRKIRNAGGLGAI